MSRFTYIGAAYLVLIREGKVLLQRRCNTGFEHGKYGLPSGHLDGNETAREGCVREMKEEIDIRINPEDMEVLHVMHRKCPSDERIDFFMSTQHYEGEGRNCEPEKCDDLDWFALDALPENTIDYIRKAVEHIRAGVFYSEYGW